MIIGVGIDLLEIERVRKLLLEPTGERFIERVLSPVERDLVHTCKENRRAEFIAGRYAAKEAVSKALGTGIGKKLGLHDIEVLPDENGKPICRLSEASLERLGYGGRVHIHLSITHSQTIAAAYAIAEKVPVLGV